MNEPQISDEELQRLLGTVFRVYHYDFRSYAMASLKRRVTAALGPLGCTDVPGLEARILEEPRAFTDLLRFLTVQVSDLFRDPSYFRAIRERVVPYLQTYPSFKLWVAGCATGEEAYSFAIILAEEGLLDRAFIYATDIRPESLKVAEQGMYELARFGGFSTSYLQAGGKGSLSDFYTARYSSAIFDRGLKARILFSDHSLATDSVFSEVELVSCRNVLIYFDQTLQNRALRILHDSLGRGGFLGLGSKESLRFSTFASAFSAFVPEERIYRRL